MFNEGVSNEGGTEYRTRTEVFGQTWGWYQSIYAIAQGNLCRFHEVTKLGLEECFAWLVFEKQKNELEAAMRKEALNKNR